MSAFKSIKIRGTTYGFDHLLPLTIEVAADKDDPSRKLTVLINFSCHCFTDALDKATHTPDYHYIHEGDERAFSLARYQHSLSLPDILKAIENKRVYFTHEKSFVLVETIDEAGAKVPYTVFLDVKKGNKRGIDVVVSIVSAYAKPDMTSWASPIRFKTLVWKIHRGEKPTPTPNKQRIRK